MFIDKVLFSDKTPATLKKGLDFHSDRQMLVSTNISNVDTPGYKAVDIDFAKQLRETAGSRDGLNLAVTDKNHIGPSDNAVKQMTPEVFEEPDAAKSNGNNVNIDKEMTKLAENQIMYNAIAQLMTKRGSTLRSAVTELVQQ